jgi:hypothetical protein
VSTLKAQARALELELAQANGERDAQRAADEQKAKEVKSQATVLWQNVEALVARAAQLLLKKMAIGELTDTLLQKDVLLEVQGSALDERGASMSSLLQHVDVARAQLEEGNRRTEGKCLNSLKLIW